MVAPSFRRSIAITGACLVPSRFLRATGAGLGSVAAATFFGRPRFFVAPPGQPWLDAMRANVRDFSLQPHLGLARTANWLPSSGATITTEGMSNSTVGTVSTPGLAATSLATSMRRWRLTSAAVADSASDQRSGVFTCWRGNAAGLGGWTFVTRISLATLQATGMAFIGLYGLGRVATRSSGAVFDAGDTR